jgi:cation transport ATPase
MTRHALAAERKRFASLIRIRRGGVELMVPVASLRRGDVTIVEPGAVLPVDGVVLDGSATVDERRITGAAESTDKKERQPVYAGTRVISGRLVIEVARGRRDTVETETRRRLIESARVEPLSATPGAALARRAAPPVLALSAVGAVTGGLGTAVAILAPNYSAAPGLAMPLDRSATLIACANAGFLVRDEAALLRLAQADAVVIDPGSGEPEAVALQAGLRTRGIERVLLEAPTASLLRRLRRRGMKVALIGGGENLEVCREADVAITLGGLQLPGPEAADIVLVTPRIVSTLDLVDLARMHAQESKVSRHLGLWPNVVAVGGALVMGFGSLHCTLFTNLGALAVYWRGNRRLREAEALWREGRP